MPRNHDVVVQATVTNQGPDLAPFVALEIHVPGVLGSLTSVPAVPCVPNPFTQCALGSLGPGDTVRFELRFTTTDLPVMSEWIVRDYEPERGFRSFDPDRANNIARVEVRLVGRPR